MKILIIGGFLGSGKTSILVPIVRRLAGDRHGCMNVAVIENEIGEISIDGITLERGGFEVTNLYSGCICCTLSGDLIHGIQDIETRIDPEWIVIETTGLAYPDRIAESIRQYVPSCEKIMRINVVDAERFEKLTTVAMPLLTGQIRHADIVFLNKIDLASAEDVRRIRERIRGINTDADIFEISAVQGLDAGIFEQIGNGT